MSDNVFKKYRWVPYIGTTLVIICCIMEIIRTAITKQVRPAAEICYCIIAIMWICMYVVTDVTKNHFYDDYLKVSRIADDLSAQAKRVIQMAEEEIKDNKRLLAINYGLVETIRQLDPDNPILRMSLDEIAEKWEPIMKELTADSDIIKEDAE